MSETEKSKSESTPVRPAEDKKPTTDLIHVTGEGARSDTDQEGLEASTDAALSQLDKPVDSVDKSSAALTNSVISAPTSLVNSEKASKGDFFTALFDRWAARLDSWLTGSSAAATSSSGATDKVPQLGVASSPAVVAGSSSREIPPATSNKEAFDSTELMDPNAPVFTFPLDARRSDGSAVKRGSEYGVDRGDHVHQGQDIRVGEGTPIVLTQAAKVLRAGYQADGAGNYVVLALPGGGELTFMHLKVPVHFSKGAEIPAGKVLGLTGNTGHSTGPHLHFEVHQKRADGTLHSVNPDPWLPAALRKLERA